MLASPPLKVPEAREREVIQADVEQERQPPADLFSTRVMTCPAAR
jgi:hypothetical protein